MSMKWKIPGKTNKQRIISPTGQLPLAIILGLTLYPQFVLGQMMLRAISDLNLASDPAQQRRARREP
jgi:hypothetical protein